MAFHGVFISQLIFLSEEYLVFQSAENANEFGISLGNYSSSETISYDGLELGEFGQKGFHEHSF